ncbi:unnamed protein product [Schistocephalus solidus]|uniref:Vps8 domain-containing protein n=1 Tax=Schistocephalus solidus TaxID=70667 RepID=A0A183TKF0_SCHSO|nr:unnamed protein product [Schistocephalus solidus]
MICLCEYHKVAVPLTIVELDDGHFLEILRNMDLAPHLLEECCEFCHQPGPAVLAVDPSALRLEICYTAQMVSGREGSISRSLSVST